MSIEAGTVYIPVRPDMTGFGTAVSSGATSSVTSGSTASKMRAGLTKFGKTMAIPLVGGLVVGMGASINAASDFNETWAKTRVVFEDNAVAVKQWSRDAAESMGMSQQQAMANAAQFKSMLEPMGVSNKMADEMALSYVQLASDLASFHNMEPAAAHDAIAQAVSGEFEGLKRLGVVINETRLKEEALRLGLIKKNEEMTQAQKEQAIYSLVMKDTSKAQGDFARTSDSLANRQRTVAASFQDSAAKLGKVLLPIAIKFMDWMGRFINWIVKDFVPRFTSGLERIGGWIRTFRDAVVSVFDGLKNTLAGVYNWIVSNIINPLITGINVLIDGINALPGFQHINPVQYLNTWTPSDSNNPATGGTSRGGRNPSASERVVVIRDQTEGGVTARQRHDARMARSNR
jgi:hypothetical protein